MLLEGTMDSVVIIIIIVVFSTIPNCTKICQETWKLKLQINLHPYIMHSCHCTNFQETPTFPKALQRFVVKQPTRCTKYPKSVIKLYMFQASSVTIIRSYLLYTQQLVHFMQVMWPLPSRVRMELWSSNLTLLEFYDKINFGYLMHLVGCFIRSLSRCAVTWT
jgi:hypothetical protein